MDSNLPVIKVRPRSSSWPVRSRDCFRAPTKIDLILRPNAKKHRSLYQNTLSKCLDYLYIHGGSVKSKPNSIGLTLVVSIRLLIVSPQPDQMSLAVINACMHKSCMEIHVYTSLHGGSVKTKPNCLCHIYLMPNHIILKLSRYLENSTSNMIPTHRNIYLIDKKI